MKGTIVWKCVQRARRAFSRHPKPGTPSRLGSLRVAAARDAEARLARQVAEPQVAEPQLAEAQVEEPQIAEAPRAAAAKRQAAVLRQGDSVKCDAFRRMGSACTSSMTRLPATRSMSA